MIEPITYFQETCNKLQGLIKFYPFVEKNYDESLRFSFAKCSWYLRKDVADNCKKPRGLISLYLLRIYPGPPVTLQCNFGIENANGEVEPVLDSFNYTFENVDEEYGYPKCVNIAELMVDLLPKDILTIHFTIQEKNNPLKLIEFQALSDDFAALLDDAKSSDITLRVKDKEFPAHKPILVARSPVFSAMFQHDMSENETGVVSIADCHPDSFAIFLQYLYSGKVESISFENAFHLYSTSHKYCVNKLKAFCIEYMKENLTVKNVCDVVSLSDQYDESELFTAAQSFFNKNFSQIVVTAEWEKLMKKDFRLGNKLLVEMSSKVKIED